MGIPIRSDGHLSKREWASANHCNRTKIYFFPYISTTPCRQRFSGTRIRCKYVLTRKSKQQPPKRQRSSHKPLCKCLSYVSAFRSSVYKAFCFLGAKIILFFCILQKNEEHTGQAPTVRVLNDVDETIRELSVRAGRSVRAEHKRRPDRKSVV